MKISIFITGMILLVYSCSSEIETNEGHYDSHLLNKQQQQNLKPEEAPDFNEQIKDEPFYWAGRNVTPANSNNIIVNVSGPAAGTYLPYIENAMNELSALSNEISMRFLQIPQPLNIVDIEINCQQNGPTDAFLPDGNGNVGSEINLGTVINDILNDQALSANQRSNWATRIIMHEFLHTLGFNHIGLEGEVPPNTDNSVEIQNIVSPTLYSILEADITNYAVNYHDAGFFTHGDLQAIDRYYDINDEVAGFEYIPLYTNFREAVHDWEFINNSFPPFLVDPFERTLFGISSTLKYGTTTANEVVDNWVISPVVKLRSGDEIEFQVAGRDGSNAWFEIRLSTAGKNSVLPTRENASTMTLGSFRYKLIDGKVADGNWHVYSFKIPEDAIPNNEAVDSRIGIVHFQSNNFEKGDFLDVDYIKITGYEID